MSWSEFVSRKMAGRKQAEVAEAAEVSQGAVSRWASGKQGVDAPQAIRFARAVGEHPMRALLAAGFLTEEEVDPTFRQPQLTNDELLELVRTRMTEEVTGNAEHPAPKTRRHLAAASGGATPEEAQEAAEAAARARAEQEAARAAMNSKKK